LVVVVIVIIDNDVGVIVICILLDGISERLRWVLKKRLLGRLM